MNPSWRIRHGSNRPVLALDGTLRRPAETHSQQPFAQIPGTAGYDRFQAHAGAVPLIGDLTKNQILSILKTVMRMAKENQVLEAATTVFLRYGYRRTTMGDLASAAGVSRPALYLLFCNKERIFEGVCRRLRNQFLEEIRTGLAALASPQDKLRLAFEIWAVRPFTLTAESPDARDLFDASLEQDQGAAPFEAQILPILEASRHPDPGQTVRVLTAAVRGFKASARSAEELRAMIEALLTMALAAGTANHRAKRT